MATRVIRPGNFMPVRVIRPGTRVLNSLTSTEQPQALQSGRGPSISHEEFEQQHGDRAPWRAEGRSPFDLLVREPRSAYEPGSPPFKNPLKFIEMLRAPFSLVAAAAARLILPKVDQQRTILTILNSSTSAGIVFIGLGFVPDGSGNAMFELPAGGPLIFDVAVPQDEVWLFSTAGATGMVGYALGGMRLFEGRDVASDSLSVKTGVVSKTGAISGP